MWLKVGKMCLDSRCVFFLNFIKVEFDREVGNVPVLYYPHDALLARSLLSKDVRLSVRLSHAGIV